MNLKEIKEMLQLMADHELTEFEIEKDGFKLSLKKGMGGKIHTETYVMPARGSMPEAVHAAPRQAGTEAGSVSAVAESPDIVLVKSPMVGTFYVAPAPDQPAYVASGSKVNSGDVLCIVEAMKLMNEIKAELAGEILEVLVKNGQPIEFDQPLFKMKKV